MDEELKKLLEDAKLNGASDDDLNSLIDMYESDKSVKKKDSLQSTIPQTNSASVTKQVQQPTSLATPKQESYDLKTQAKTPDFTNGFSIEKQGDLPIKIQKHKEEVGVWTDLTNRFKSGGLTALAGVAGTQNYINKLTASIVLDKETLAELNKLPQGAREILLASGSPDQISRIQNSAEAQNFLTDKAEKLSEKTIQYEGNIVDDIGNGDFGKASYRVIQGAVESLPSMILALSPGGLATIGASTASQKQEEQEREGADLGLKTVTNSVINGTAEAFFEKYTQGIFEPIKKMALGNKEVAKEISENLVKTILKDIGIEGGSEGLTSITQDLSDKFVAGKDVSMLQILKNSIDASIIGGFVGGSMSGVKGYVSTKTRSAETTKKINENSAMSEALKKELRQVDSESIKNALQSKIKQVDSETAEIQKAEIAKIDNLSDEQVKEVFEIDSEMKKVNQSFIELVNDDKMSPEIKKVLEKDLEQKFTELEAKKNAIVNPKIEAVEDIPSPIIEFDLTKKEEQKPAESTVTEQTNNFALQLGEPQDISDVMGGATKVKIGATEVILKDNKDNIVIESIRTDENEKGKGSAKNALKQVTDIADEQQKTLELKVVPENESTTEAGLTKLYESFGFEKDGDKMVRKPKPIDNAEIVPEKAGKPTLEEEYNGKNTEELIALKKKLYPNPDIESPMSADEKLLDKVIAKKFSEKNEAIRLKRAEKKLEVAKNDIKANEEISPIENIVPKSLKQLETENKTTTPKIPVNKVFLNDIGKAKNLTNSGVNKYLESDKESDLPIEKVSSKDIIPTQKSLTIPNLKSTQKVTDKAVLFKEGDKYYVIDGHHRIANGILNGNNEVEAHIYDSNKLDANESTPTNNPTPNADVKPNIEQNVQQGKDSGVQPTKDVTRGDGDVEVKKVKSIKDATYDVSFDENGNVTKIVSPKDNREIPKYIDRKVKKTKSNPKGLKLVLNGNYAKIESDALGTITNNMANDERKAKVANALDKFTPTDEYSHALQFLAQGGAVSLESAKNETGLSAKEVKWASRSKNKYKKDSELKTIEATAEDIVANSNQDLDVQEVRNALIDLVSNKEGANNIENEVVDIVESEQNAQKEEELYAYLGSLSEKDLSLYESIKAEDDYISELTYNQKVEYYEQEYGKKDTENDGKREGENPSIQKRDGKTSKERIAERVKISNAKIDDWANAAKGIDNIFGIPIKIKNIDDINVDGMSQNALIDMIANIVKQAVEAGINIDEAIRKTIEHFQKTIDFDINPDDVKAKINPETPKSKIPKSDNDFEKKDGKKSLLNRAFEGGNSKEVTDAIERNGLDYRIENRDIAKRNAENFVDEVGSENALQALRDNKIKGAEKAFVYSKIISNLIDEIESNTNQEQRQELEAIHAKIISDITDEFGQETIEAGRFISALQDVYNSSSLKYNLTTQINDHKALNNGEISDEVLAKFTEADNRIKELEKLITEAEINLKKAEEALLIKNIKDDIDKANKKDSKSKSVLTPKEQTRKTELRVKFFGTLNDITRMATLLGDPEFREYLGLAFKQAKGDFNNFSKQILKEVGKGARKHLPILFKEAGGKSDVSITQLSTVKIGKKGNIVIPVQLFRDYVEQGETDIDVIAGLIKEDIADEFPNADIRDIRDAITGYGKRINPSKDEVQAEMSRLKIVGKLISAYEDALQKIRPLKSGLQRAKPTQQMRDMRKEINRLIKEIGLSEADLEKEWASALDRVKSQLTNQIEDLDKQIANGEKRKIERNPLKLDDEAKNLKTIRDAKKKILDELAGKPELTEEELILRAEKSLEDSIGKLQKEIANGDVEFKIRPLAKQSKKLNELRAQRKALIEIKDDMRAEAGLVEAQRMKTTKNRVKNQISELKRKIDAKEYAKKAVIPLREDTELLNLRAEKILQQEVFDAQRYQDELKNRSAGKKFLDSLLEVWNIERILRATGELSTVLIQGGVLTTSRKFTNPKELAKIMGKLFTSIGSAKKSGLMEAAIKAHPNYALAMKAKLALANPDYKNDVREENYTGDYANYAWDLPFMFAGSSKKGARLSDIKRSVIGDVILNPFKRFTGLGKIGTEKVSAKQQWKNINPFKALERGSTLYMNTLRMEEFARGVEMLRMEGKNEIDHLKDYKLLANAINSMSGRANLPSALATNTKALSVVFFSAKNAISVINQVNPIYYGYLHFASTDGFQLKKTSVANKLAMYNMMRFVTITGATLIALKFAAGKDDDDEDVATIETDPRSSDFMKLKIGNIRWDLFHGQMGVIVLMSRLITEQVKSTKDGKVENLADKRFGQQNRLDLVGSFARNKLAPSASRLFNYLSTKEKLNPETGKMVRMTPFGKDYDDENAIANIKPMYWDAIKEISAEDPGALVQFLTVVSAFGWNTGVYGGQTPMSKNELQILFGKRRQKAPKSLAEKNRIKYENIIEKRDKELFIMSESARLGVDYVPEGIKE